MCKKKAITQRQRLIFLDVLRTTGNISASARAANISAKSAHGLKAHDVEFSQEWDLAKDESIDELEAALRKRAIEGVEKPVYYAGKECGIQRSYSDSLGMYILKTHRGDGHQEADTEAKGDKQVLREVSARELLVEKLDAMTSTIGELKSGQACDNE